MKKALSILVALVLLSIMICAYADELIIDGKRQPMDCTVESFKKDFFELINQTDYSFNWVDEPQTNGSYEVYYIHSSDNSFTVKIYAIEGKVSFVTGEGAVIILGQEDKSAGKLGKWIAVSVYGTMPALYNAEGKEYGETEFGQCSSELQKLISKLDSLSWDTKKLEKGVAVTGSILGYPAGAEMKRVGTDDIATVTAGFAITSKEGVLTVGTVE